MSARRRSGGGDQGGARAAVRLVRPLGQGEALADWLVRARLLDLPHAMVVEGARGIGKSTVLQWLAAALLCPSELDTTEPCGGCRTCNRVASGSFADLHVVDLAVHEDETKPGAEPRKSFHNVTVHQVRDLQQRLLRQAVEGRARVAVIARADTMSDEAQNALLKTLEEPGASTFVLLEASRPEQLLPTVRSRAQRLRVLPLDEPTLLAELAQRAPDRADRHAAAAALAGGSLGRALLACTERAVQIHDVVRAVLADTNGSRPWTTANLVLGSERDTRTSAEAARLFLWLLRAELRVRQRALATDPAATYPAAAAEPWTSWLESTLAAERDLDLLIPAEQVLTACLLDCRTA